MVFMQWKFVWVIKNMPGMLSIGTNPTVNTDINFRSIEVHILNFEGNIYGNKILRLSSEKD